MVHDHCVMPVEVTDDHAEYVGIVVRYDGAWIAMEFATAVALICASLRK